MKIRTHYDNLKVSRDAPKEVIDAAYKFLCDKYKNPNAANTLENAKIIEIIDHAYKVLSDPASRKKHDDWIRDKEKFSDNANHGDDYRLVMGAAKKYEALLEDYYNASGQGLHQKIDSVNHKLDDEVVWALRAIATMRNKFAHEAGVQVIPDRAKFIRACNVADEYFRNNLQRVNIGSSIVLKGGPWRIVPLTLDDSPYHQRSAWVSYFNEHGYQTQRIAAEEADKIRAKLSFNEQSLLDEYKIENIETGDWTSYSAYYESGFGNSLLNIIIFSFVFLSLSLVSSGFIDGGLMLFYVFLSMLLTPIIRAKWVRPIVNGLITKLFK